MVETLQDIAWIAAGAAPLTPEEAGPRAAWLSRAAAAGAPVPPAAVLAGEALAAAAGEGARAAALAERLAGLAAAGGPAAAALGLVSVRPGVPGGGELRPAVLDLGLTPQRLADLAARLGARAAADLERRHVEAYGTGVLGLPREAFEYALYDALKARGAESEADLSADDLAALAAEGRRILAEAGGAIPADPGEQIAAALAAMRAAWTDPKARRRRAARGLPPAGAQPVMVQALALGLGPGISGAAVLATRDAQSGRAGLTGRYLPEAQGAEAIMGARTPVLLSRADREAQGLRSASLEERAPEIAARLGALAADLERRMGDALALEVTIEAGRPFLLDLQPAPRSARAALRMAVDLAEEGAIPRETALARVAPARLDDFLHPTVAPGARAETVARGLAASPGAASGPLVFSPDAAEAAAGDGTPAILALVETGPEDIRGMHAAAGVLTVRGGMTSHAALVARGLGRPCVVGARALELDRATGTLATREGRLFRAGDVMTVDGTEGRVLAGPVETRPPEITGAFARLLSWADATRSLGVRANADTAQDAATARRFLAEGIGLCRTEHMFFQRGRIAAMREMILAESPEERRGALARLAPMQRGDFVELFRRMPGLPVVIRLLDPPLHEFLPHDADEIEEMAAHLGVPAERVRARARELAEFNPMLGKRGCRIGIAYPEIYEMQAQAILEAAGEAAEATGEPVTPEIMIPLVSAVRELEVLRGRIDAVAERAGGPAYRVGVMVETPRACLRAGEIARIADFLSFGTNDLTQMLYGLSRDDAGRFMPDYVAQGVFAHDPFHRIDEEGVGEIIRLAIARARAAKPDISIGLCGEHGGDPASVEFCARTGFDYVSCSPYRVPVARLAAAQAALAGRA